MILTAWARLGEILAVITCIYAFWRGGPYERLGAAILSIGWIATDLTFIFVHQGPNIGVFYIDLIGFFAYYVIAFKSRFIWTLFATAFQFNAVLSHIVAMNFPGISTNSYAVINGVWGGYGLIFSLLGAMIAKDICARRQLPPKG